MMRRILISFYGSLESWAMDKRIKLVRGNVWKRKGG